MMKKLLVIAAALLVGAACSTAPCACSAPPVSPTPEATDAAKAPTCSSACTHLRELHCSLGDPTPKGGTCEKVCANVQTNNAGVGFPVVCLAGAKDCGAADACR